MQILNTLAILALVLSLIALFVAVPVLHASTEDSGRSSCLILIGGGPGAGQLGHELGGGLISTG
jgi:photosystem II PsbZ protein